MAASYAKHYIGSRPQLTPGAMKRVGGGFSNMPAPLQDEIEGLYALVERLRSEKERADATAATATEAAGAARANHQALADELIARRERERNLSAQLTAAQAALADRGLSFDAATQRVSALESQSRSASVAQREATMIAESARAEAAAAEARAVERDKQVEVLMQALRERTVELEKLKEREGRESEELHRLRANQRREFEDMSHRAGELERELRRTLAADERRHESELAAVRGELEHTTRRCRAAEEVAEQLEREVAGARHDGREQIAAQADELDSLRQEVSSARQEAGRAQRHADEMERELGRARRQLGEASRQLEADSQRQLSGYARDLERVRAEGVELRVELEQVTASRWPPDGLSMTSRWPFDGA